MKKETRLSKVQLKRCTSCGMWQEIPADRKTCPGGCQKIKHPIDDEIEKLVLKLFKNGTTLEMCDLCESLDRSPATVAKILQSLSNQGHNLVARGSAYELSSVVELGHIGQGVVRHAMEDYEGGVYRFGATGDWHLGSRHARLDVINALADIYEREGVSDVYHTGNWIEGEARFNFSDVSVHGLDEQIAYAIDNWPQRKGITWYFVAGDDHEGWYQQKTRLQIGRHMERVAREKGREDLVYIGYMEGHVVLKAPEGQATMMVLHPGGGSAYAESYACQKIAEAFQEGEKPNVCLVGHYHKIGYGYHRGIHMVQTGTCQDQSTFMRKNRIKAAVGGTLVELHQDPLGRINRFKPEFFTFYDRELYGASGRDWLGGVDMPQVRKTR